MKKIIYIFIALLIVGFSSAPITLASGFDFKNSTGLEKTANESGYLNTVFNSEDSLESGIGNIIALVLSFLGVIFLILIIVGGISWMTAAGNDQQIEKAKSLITNAAIGVLIVFSAYAITWFVVRVLMDKTLMS